MPGLLLQILHEHAQASVDASPLGQRGLLVVHRGEQWMREPNAFGVRRPDQPRGNRLVEPGLGLVLQLGQDRPGRAGEGGRREQDRPRLR